jgi:CRP-like cAMP-binding protein
MEPAANGSGPPAAAPLLALDSELGARVPPSELRRAKRELIARTTLLRAGDSGEELFDPSLFGALVVEGALTRRVSTGRGRSLEVVVKGDLLRPWQEDSGWVLESTIHALVDTRVAVLDRHVATAVCEYPALVDALLDRAFRRIRSRATQAAFDSRAGMDERVLSSMWHLADRCGERTEAGIVIPLPLTHQMIADLVGAQRTSVSAAISRLATEGTLSRTDGRGWELPSESARLLPSRR